MNARLPGERLTVVAWLAIAAAVLLIVGANAHLVYMAVTTQPECVAHAREGVEAAAKSACRQE